MPHARIINTEFKSKEDLELSIIAWQKWSPYNMPDSLSRYIVRTGEKSTMMTAVYENEELLNQAQVIAMPNGGKCMVIMCTRLSLMVQLWTKKP